MNTKKLDAWAQRLLDIGKRNNLICYRDTRAATAEILLPDVGMFFRKLDEGVGFEVYDPCYDDDTDEEESEGKSKKEDREAYLQKYGPKIKRKNLLLLYNEHSSPVKVAKNIYKSAKQNIEETGVNIAYVAFGFIHWTESEHSKIVYEAPLLLIPIQFEHGSGIDPYYIHSTGDGVAVNPTFSFKLEMEYGIKIPEYDDEALEDYLEKVRSAVSGLKWDVSCDCRIGKFFFQKINMYRDLKDNSKRIMENQNVRMILGEETARDDIGDGTGGGHTVKNPLVDLHSVVDADSSQIEAIVAAKEGASFVLKGPPGTGKSQTITNIIAEFLADGKKVLFVSEKLAALEVVYDKLSKAGLGEFCLPLHSHKANKKDVITELCNTLNTQPVRLDRSANEEILAKEAAQKKLDDYACELHRQRDKIGKSLYQLYQSYAALRHMPKIQWKIENIKEKGESYRTEAAALLEQYAAYVPTIGYDYRKNPWYGYHDQNDVYQMREEVEHTMKGAVAFWEEAASASAAVAGKYGVACETIEQMERWGAFLQAAASSSILTPALFEQKTFEKCGEALEKLSAISDEISAIEETIRKEYTSDFFGLEGGTLHMKLTDQFSGKFSRLFNKEYKTIINQLRACRKSGEKPSYEDAISATKLLIKWESQRREFSSLESSVSFGLGDGYQSLNTDWEAVMADMEQLRAPLESVRGMLGDLRKCTPERFEEEKESFAQSGKDMEHIMGQWKETFSVLGRWFDKTIFDWETADAPAALEKCRACLDNMDLFVNWGRFSSVFAQLRDIGCVPFLDAVTNENVEPHKIVDTFNGNFYRQWIDHIVAGTPALYGFDRISQDQAVRIFAEKDKEQFEINRVKIRATLSSSRPDVHYATHGSGVSLILREGQKKRRQKSIRTLFREFGPLVQQIKPCFLMSPLSVSTFLDPEAIHFDAVVFDEASQIFPQDAIGAIYRGDQLIVAGDPQQMPPSNFFNASISEEDREDEEDDVGVFESILDICSAELPTHELEWHYRSRFEQLIAFSNQNFYLNHLITFPSAKVDRLGSGVDYYHVDGFMDRKSHTNEREAEFIADLVYRNFEKYPDRSLGVVAFSVQQQQRIEQMISRKRAEHPEMETFFKESGEEPFFVKNLETVQGDERDTIIFSVAYGRGKDGKMNHNFGPLSRSGGERRLNVAVTRAKYNVQVVSSMHYTDIDLARISNEGGRLLREYLDYAENGEIALQRSVSVSADDHFDSDFEADVCEFLRQHGFSVDTQVGCANFKIDLGLRREKSSDYVLAIECDGATYHSSKNARDRDRLRQEILEDMGWKFYRIWSTDWFRNDAVEKERLLKAVRKAIAEGGTESGGSVKVEQTVNPQRSVFEKPKKREPLQFPRYYEVSPGIIKGDSFLGMVLFVLKTEAPMAEELLIKRLAPVIWNAYGKKVNASWIFYDYIDGYSKYGIAKKDDFYYLKGAAPVQFRVPDEFGNGMREIKHIAPEELAAGMLEIIRYYGEMNQKSLYRILANYCGKKRVGYQMEWYFDEAFKLLYNEVNIVGEMISLDRNNKS